MKSRGQGKGIKLAKIIAAQPSIPEMPPPEEVEPPRVGEFVPEPSFSNQWATLKEHCRVQLVEFQIFKVSTPEGKEAFDIFNRRRGPEGAPDLIVLKEQEYFSPNNSDVIVTVRYRRILYRKLNERPRSRK